MGPDFIVIGAMKCGTSTVCAYFEDHPDAFMVPRCEPNFFSHDANFARGQAWYEEFFADAEDGTLRGEGSNDYANSARYPDSADRMAALYPEVKLIYMVRHPLKRIRSAWVQTRYNSGDAVPPTLDQAVQTMPEVFVDQSLYWKNLTRYRAHFDDSRIFIGFLEEMEADRTAFFARLTGFLGLDPTSEVRRGHQNPSAGKRIPSPLYTRINNNPATKTLKKLVPAGLRKSIKTNLLSRKVERPPEFSIPVHGQITDMVQDDMALFLEYAGQPADFWSLSA